MIGFDLLRPGLLGLLFLAPLVLGLGALGLVRRRRELALWLDPRQWSRAHQAFSLDRARARVALATLALLFLAFAALGPVRGYTTRPVATRGLDLVVCIDTSRSMLAQDLRPSRLERAKREVLGLLERLKGDRVALIAFSGDSREVAPLTRDRSALADLLGFVTSDDNQVGGTNLAAAIERALSMFDGRSGAHEAIVLLTDGEDLEGQGAALAAEAAKRKIRVYVVGIGTEAGGKIPVVGAGGRAEFLRDPEGAEVVTRLEGETLERLASSTGGAYLSAEASPTPLEDLYRARVSQLEGREISSGERKIPHDRYQWALVLALVLMLVESGLRERRRAPRSAARVRAAAAALLLVVVPDGETFSFATTLAKAIDAHRSNAPEKARLALESLRKEADSLGLTESERARLEYAAGVIYAARLTAAEPLDEAASADRELALTGFGSARALAGPGELRLDATYDLGVLALWDGERARALLPELGGAPAGAPVPGPHAAPPGAGDAGDAADPLQVARAAYRAARTWFLERLRAEWQDEDTRANLELVQRRLRELDRIEEQRKQQQQEQQQQEQQDQENEDQQEGEQGENQEPSKDGEQGKDQSGEPGQDPSQREQQPSEDEQPQPGEEQPEPQPGEESGEEQPGQEEPAAPQEEPPGASGEEQPGAEQPAGAAGAGDAAERVLTREEVMRLLDKLADLEERGRALEAALRAARRVPVKKDW